MPEARTTKHKGDIEKYGLCWSSLYHPVQMEIEMIRQGGRFKTKSGKEVGEGLLFHYKQLQKLLWPNKVWHQWNEMLLQNFVEHRITGVMGPAASGKTFEASLFFLTDYYCFPECTTVLVSSTELEILQKRAWGEIKRAHKSAKERFEFLPGNLIESKYCIVTDERNAGEGRDFRNGLACAPCKKGGSFIGLGAYSGIHNKRMRLLADEGQFMPPAYVDAISNLAKAKDFKCIVIGNPKDTTDALGKICEPSAQIGGWDSGIDQTGGTKTWPIRFPNSVCVQLVGTDSPNLDGKLGIELITQEQINADVQFYGTSSLQYMMMDEARMPRGQASRRVLTRRLCERCHAMEEPVWKDENQVRIGFLDAAYRGVGGDRCIFGELRFGTGLWEFKPLQMLALIDIMVVPIVGGMADEPEHQIADFVKMQCVIRGIVPQNFFFDSTGRGSLMNAFAKYWSPQIVGVEFGGPGTERKVSNEIPALCKDYYSKFVSELWYSVRLAVESQQIRGFTEELMNEFCMREWGMTKGNRVEVEPKDKTKLRMGRSPDLADGFCCGLEGARQRGFIIQKLSSNAISSKGDAWKDEVRKRIEQLNAGHTLNYAA